MGCCGSSHSKKHTHQTQPETQQRLSPLDLLKIRLARGEISFEEYEKTKKVLTE